MSETTEIRRPHSCTFPGCLDPVLAKGLCAGHYHQRRRKGELTTKRGYTKTYNGQECPVKLCHEAQASIGLCWGHASLAQNRGMNAARFVEIYVEPVRHRAIKEEEAA